MSVGRGTSETGGIGLRARLVMLVCVAIAPLLMLVVAATLIDRDVALGDARAKALQLATLGAERQADVLRNAADVLKTLRRLPATTLGPNESCPDLLRAIVADHPQFNTIGVADRDGSLRCHTMVSDRKSFGDMELFNSAMKADAPLISVGRLRSGKISGKPAVIVASPLPPEADGRPAGMVFVSLQLSSFGRAATDLLADDDRRILVIEPRSGTILARAPDPDSLAGGSYPDHPLVRAISAAPGAGVVDADDFDGTPRLFGFAPLPGVSGRGPVLAIGLSQVSVLAKANARLRVEALIALAASLIALLGATVFGGALLEAPIRSLSEVAGRLRLGDLTARARIAAWQAPEFHMLGDALGAMAEGVSSAQKALRSSEAELRILAEHSTDMVFKLDVELRRIYVSPSSREVLGFDACDLLGETSLAGVHPEDAPHVEETFRDLVAGREWGSIVNRIRHQDGRWIWVEANMRLLRDRDSAAPIGILGSMRDISRRKSVEMELEALNQRLRTWAHQDALTGLANRRSFDETLTREWRRAMRESWSLGLIMIDVDAFKAYNDTNGHQMGDQCLQAVAGTIRQCLDRSADMAARYGGEEFVVILPNTDRGGCLAIAERIRSSMEALAIPHAQSAVGYVTISAGLAWFDAAKQFMDASSLVSMADRNLYAAKVAGRNRIVSGDETRIVIESLMTVLEPRQAFG